ncbi:probable LRR receptor-like serine/threonine-protein kinase At1g34110 [Papaver somniferum]|uniref:probable LRR receptor-like serine/threonine-protein kinase At1g34110 n=1 Tax=Papaver somniferum TaxID=3469 RepID=UPI000E6FA1AB|nr:probable LRR receptor-like serine/threonine-protein kinase At1g34110 [Papaver somniferum]
MANDIAGDLDLDTVFKTRTLAGVSNTCFISVAFSQLSSNQRDTMIKLSNSFNNKKYHRTKSLFMDGKGLDVSGNSLSSIPDVFISDCGKLNGLKKLNFSQNKLSGVLPNFTGFSSLVSLDLSMNYLTVNLDGLIGNFKVLEKLQLSRNHFVGPIPDELFNFQNLTLIDLSVNNISGVLSNSIGDLSKLNTLLLSSNNLSGEIPKSLSNIKTLTRLAANQNSFNGSSSLNGSIPSASIGKLERLTYLELGSNSLSGEIPKELGNCVELALLDLSKGAGQNILSGSIPSGISNLRGLVSVNLQDNELNGSIPDSISNLEFLIELQLGKNCLSSRIPKMPSNLQISLDLSRNCFEGTIPETLGGLRALEVLDISNNKFQGLMTVIDASSSTPPTINTWSKKTSVTLVILIAVICIDLGVAIAITAILVVDSDTSLNSKLSLAVVISVVFDVATAMMILLTS